jgi:hypothetical protein
MFCSYPWLVIQSKLPNREQQPASSVGTQTHEHLPSRIKDYFITSRITLPATRSNISPVEVFSPDCWINKKYSNSQISFSGSDSFVLHIIAVDGNTS